MLRGQTDRGLRRCSCRLLFRSYAFRRVLHAPDAYASRIGCVSLDGSRFEAGGSRAFARCTDSNELPVLQDYVALSLGHLPSTSSITLLQYSPRLLLQSHPCPCRKLHAYSRAFSRYFFASATAFAYPSHEQPGVLYSSMIPPLCSERQGRSVSEPNSCGASDAQMLYD